MKFLKIKATWVQKKRAQEGSVEMLVHNVNFSKVLAILSKKKEKKVKLFDVLFL